MAVPPDTVYLKDRPAPVTVPIVRTEAEAAGHMVTWIWGRDSIEMSGQAPLLPARRVASAAWKGPDGVPYRDAEGRPIPLGDRGGRNSMETLTTVQGLALDAVTCSALDHLGNLWVGTQGGGVSRYDGHGFTNFTTAQGLADNAVSSIVVGADGHIWISTMGGGISRYDGRSFTTYTTDDGLPTNNVSTLAMDRNGQIWMGTSGGGLTRYDGKSFRTYTTEDGLLGNTVSCIVEDRDGHLWIGSYSGLSRFDGESFTGYTTADGLADVNVLSIAADRQGVIWIGGQHTLSRFDGTSFSSVQLEEGTKQINIGARCITVDRAGQIWMGMRTGLLRFDGRSFTGFVAKQGLAHDDVRCITEDLAGNIWIGTFGGGLSRYGGRAFVSYTQADGLADDPVMAITGDGDGKLWFGTLNGGVTTYDGSIFETYGGYQGVAGTMVGSILEDSAGVVWIGAMGGGLSRYDGKTFVNYNTSQGLVHNVVQGLTLDRAGNLWVGTMGGLSRFDGKSFVNYTTAQGLADNTVYCMTKDALGNLWIGTAHGASRFDGSSFVNFTTANGMTDDLVLKIAQDAAGNIWVATDGGLSLLPRPEQDSPQRGTPLFERFTKEDGLPDNVVSAVLEGDSGIVYVGTNLGICELLPAPDSPKGFVVGRTFNSATGYPVKDVNQGAMYKDRHGLIWIGTGSKEALVCFDRTALRDALDPPRVLIQGVRLHEEPVCWNALLPRVPGDSAALALAMFNVFGNAVSEDVLRAHRKKLAGVRLDSVASWYPVPQDLVLPYAHNHITFDFAAIEMGRNAMVRYQYMLEGYDADWGPITASRSAVFGNMREGNYTFMVKARSPEGVWSEPVTYTFEVLPPWYRTWWMYAVYVITALGLVLLIVYLNSRRLIAQKKILEHKVQVRTREVVMQKKEIEQEKAKSDNLLLNILPVEVAEELKVKGEADARLIEEVTVLFTDFAGFTAMSEKVSPQALVKDLHECFTAFDHIMGRHGLEKIKTIGDSYMAAGGLPTPNDTHAGDAVRAAMEMRDFIAQGKTRKQAAGLPWFEVRIGIHTGPVVAGIVGVKKFSYDIWGDTVNTASRMEQNGEPGKVNISAATYERVKDNFRCTFRGEIAVKGKGEMKMYFVEPADG